MNIVPLEEIPPGPYSAPGENLSHIFGICQKMEDFCRQNSGMGLAASQIGLPWNVFVYWSNWPKETEVFEYLVDCEYSPLAEATSMSVEGCLSLPGLRFALDRFDFINVRGKKLLSVDGEIVLEDFENNFRGVAAVIIQHEIDHKYGREKMIDKIGKRIHIR